MYRQCLKQHTHNCLRPFFRDYPGEPVPEKILLLDFMVQREISEADTPTIWLGATPSVLISNPPSSSPLFCAATLPIYPGLGQAPNMLACIPSGLVASNSKCACNIGSNSNQCVAFSYSILSLSHFLDISTSTSQQAFKTLITNM